MQHRALIERIGRQFNATPEEILSRSHRRRVREARIAVYQAMHDMGMGPTAIGAAVGGRHNSDICHLLRKHGAKQRRK